MEAEVCVGERGGPSRWEGSCGEGASSHRNPPRPSSQPTLLVLELQARGQLRGRRPQRLLRQLHADLEATGQVIVTSPVQRRSAAQQQQPQQQARGMHGKRMPARPLHPAPPPPAPPHRRPAATQAVQRKSSACLMPSLPPKHAPLPLAASLSSSSKLISCSASAGSQGGSTSSSSSSPSSCASPPLPVAAAPRPCSGSSSTRSPRGGRFGRWPGWTIWALATHAAVGSPPHAALAAPAARQTAALPRRPRCCYSHQHLLAAAGDAAPRAALHAGA